MKIKLTILCLVLLAVLATTALAEQTYYLKGENPISADKALVMEAMTARKAGDWDKWESLLKKKVYVWPGLPVRILEQDQDGFLMVQMTVGPNQRPMWTVMDELSSTQP